MKKTGFFFIAILTVTAVLRLWNLGIIPTGITNDESLFIYNAYSISETGKDTTGKFLPLAPHFDNSLSPVSFYIIAPFVKFLGLSAFSGRLPFALSGILTVFLLYHIVMLLTKNRALALTSMFVLAVSPWHIHMSRIAYEQTLALFFMLLTLFMMLRFHKSNQIILSLIPFALSFYSYNAIKIFLILWYPITLYALYKLDPKISKKSIIFSGTGFILILITFFIIIKTENVTRQSVFFWSNIDPISRLVNWERSVNVSPSWIQPVFNNKLLTMLRMTRENYLESFSPQLLFLYGETSGLAQIYGTSWRGMMYIIELPLLLLGVYFLFKHWGLWERYILICLLLSPLPATFTIDRSYGARAIMMLPFLAIITAFGIYSFMKIFVIKRKSWLVLTICSIWYIYLISSYVYQYHFRYKIYGAESFFQSSKELAEYIINRSPSFKRTILVDGGGFIHQYAFYKKLSPQDAYLLYTMPMPKSLNNLYFIDSCIEKQTPITTVSDLIDPGTLYIAPAKCHINLEPTWVIRDKGEPLRLIWKIFENPINNNRQTMTTN